MMRQERIKAFYDHHVKFSDYIDALDDRRFVFSYHGKWTAGQQLSHVHLTLMPFPGILPSAELIRHNFGEIHCKGMGYDAGTESGNFEESA